MSDSMRMFYFRTKKCQPSVSNILPNQDHYTVVAGGEVSFNAKKEPSQIKLPSSVQEALSDRQWNEAMKLNSIPYVATKLGR